jgi:hypothetical protein
VTFAGVERFEAQADIVNAKLVEANRRVRTAGQNGKLSFLFPALDQRVADDVDRGLRLKSGTQGDGETASTSAVDSICQDHDGMPRVGPRQLIARGQQHRIVKSGKHPRYNSSERTT